jgi:hypothetical protein
LPVSLPAVIERYQHRYFKIKLSGDPGHDIERLRAVLLGLTHRERNGHYSGGGFGSTPASESRAFANAHADLYEIAADSRGCTSALAPLRSTRCSNPDLRTAFDPDLTTLQPLDTAAALP